MQRKPRRRGQDVPVDRQRGERRIRGSEGAIDGGVNMLSGDLSSPVFKWIDLSMIFHGISLP